MDHGSYPYMYLVSVLFISSIPHLTLHPLHFFKMFLYLFTVFFFCESACMCVYGCMHVRTCMCLCVYVSTEVEVQVNLGAVKT